MNLLKYIFSLVLIAPLGAWAAVSLPEPSVLLAKAQQDRIQLREVILDIEMNIPEMRDQPTFEKYFYMLEDLTQLSERHRLEEIYPQIVSRLGLRMVGNGMRWLNVTTDSSEKLQYYVKWMDADTLNRFLDNTSYQLALIKDRNLLATMATNIESLLPLVDARADGQTQLMSGFRRLFTDVAVLILRNKNLPDAEVNFWVGKLMVPASISEYADVVTQDIYLLNSKNKELGFVYLSRLLVLNAQAAKVGTAGPVWLMNSIGEAVSELLLRSVSFELSFTPLQFTQGLDALSGRQVLGLSQQWMAQTKPPGANYVTHYLDLSRILIARLKALGLNKDADELNKWLAQTAAPVMAQKLDLEGHYELTNSKGETWFFTIAVAKENTLIASLADAQGMIFKTFYNITYNLKDNGFVASEREPDTYAEQNPPVKFTVNENGAISIVDPFVRNGTYFLNGHKVQSFTNLWKTAKADAPSADGTYEGTLFLPNGSEMQTRLIITTFNGYSTGRIDSGTLSIDLNIGSQGTDGVIILTSGRKLGASWFQVRANVTETGLNAYVIVGGKGQGVACSFLKRVEIK